MNVPDAHVAATGSPRHLLAFVCIAALAGCRDFGAPVGLEDPIPSPTAIVIVAPAPPYRVVIGNSMQFRAEVIDQHGAPIQGATTAWTSSDTTVATIGPDGLMRGVTAGTTEIRAFSGALESVPAMTQVVTTAGDVETITIVAPKGLRVERGSSLQLEAEVRDATGTLVPGAAISWSSSATSVAAIDANGLATALAPGSTDIRAASGSVQSDAVTVTVFAVTSVAIVAPSNPTVVVNGTVQFVAEARDDTGALVTVPILWSSDDPTVATIDSAGVATGIRPGASNIRARARDVESVPRTLTVLTQAPDFDTDVQPIFTSRCASSGCHGGGNPKEGLSLESGRAYDETVNVPSNRLPQWLLVEPGDAQASFLFRKIADATPPSGARMPLSGSNLSSQDIQTIRDWIDAGAPR